MKKKISMALILMFVPGIAFSSEHQQKTKASTKTSNGISKWKC